MMHSEFIISQFGSASISPYSSHWISLNGKRDNFTKWFLYFREKLIPIFNKRKIDDIIYTTIEHVSIWRKLGREWDQGPFV